MDASFEERIAPYRRELLAHCYRMTGSLADAEDALQESLVRAWRGLASFEGRSSLRTWLYRVTTNTCLNVAEKRTRSLPHHESPPGTADDATQIDFEPRWLEPFPDKLIDDPDARPDAVYTRREAVRLAFIAALQRLPGRQRAVLILRDVVALSPEETAAILDSTVTAANSLLQRARERMEKPAEEPADPSSIAELLARYLRAWETGDAKELIAVLRADAIASMPPNPLWVRGVDAVIDAMQKLVWSGGPIRMLPYAANAQPSFAVYQQRGDVWVLACISIVELSGAAISATHHFLTIDPSFKPERYELAPHL